MLVFPTDNWVRKISIPVGEGGFLSPTGDPPFFVSDIIGQWLVENNYATTTTEPERSTKSTDPEETWKASVIDLIKESSELKGIPTDLLDSIKENESITWEKIEATFKPQYVKILRKIVEEK